MDCMNLYMSVLSGLGCSQSFLGTVTESMATDLMRQMEAIANVEIRMKRRSERTEKKAILISDVVRQALGTTVP